MPPPINFGEIPSPSISHAHPKTPRPTKKKAVSENKVREIDELDTFIVKNNFNCDTIKEALQESLLLYGLSACNADRREQALASFSRGGCMHEYVIYFHIRLRDADAGVTVIQFENYNGFKLVTHPNFPCKTVNQWDQLEVVLHFYTGTG